MTEVPVIDVGAMRGADARARRRLAQEVYDACHDLGFFYIVNHGVPTSAIEDIFDAARQFFSLPLSEKMEISLIRSPHFRGYLPMKMQGSAAELPGNQHEGFQLEEDLPPDDPDVLAGKLLRGPNQWPASLPALRERAMRYHTLMKGVSFDLLGVFAASLGLPENSFQKYYGKTQSQLRFLHYPPQAPTDVNGFGVWAHTDSGGFAMLSQDDNGGLEVMNRNGEWLSVPPVPNSYVVNIGEMMKLWSDGLFAATPHRVINRSGRERYSIPFFATPGSDTVIEPLLRNTSGTEAPSFHTSIARGTQITCGELLASTYAKVWPSPLTASYALDRPA